MRSSSWSAADGCRPAAATPSMHHLAAGRAISSSSCRAADECSPAYVTNAQDLADTAQDTDCDVLYVVGGLYGNVAALDALEEGIARERRHGLHIEVCCNGDFNFFNASSEAWARINQGVRALETRRRATSSGKLSIAAVAAAARTRTTSTGPSRTARLI